VDKVFQHLVEADFCEKRAAWLGHQLVARNLACLSLSAHMDLTQPDSLDRFVRRIEFAAAVGASIVNSIAGPTASLDGFRKNIPALAKRAEALGITIALENHGDLLDREQQILDLIREIGHPAVRVNYDTGNAWYYSKGEIDSVAELALLAPVVAHLHVKTPKVVDGLMRWVALGDGELDLARIGRLLQETMPGIAVSYELSPRQRSRDFEPRWRAPEIPPLPEIRSTITRSLQALARVLS
jgi:sugar phosphate isomerase/epimerase